MMKSFKPAHLVALLIIAVLSLSCYVNKESEQMVRMQASWVDDPHNRPDLLIANIHLTPGLSALRAPKPPIKPLSIVGHTPIPQRQSVTALLESPLPTPQMTLPADTTAPNLTTIGFRKADGDAPQQSGEPPAPALAESAPAASLPSDFVPAELGAARSFKVPILMYHYLSVPPADADIYRLDLSVTPDLFAAQLDQLQAEGYTTINLYEMMAHLFQGMPLPEKPVILTFDDGYLDNYQNAFPALQARGMKATFFVVIDFINQARPGYMTWEMLRQMQQAGMSIEAHGIEHSSLKGRTTDELIFQALRCSETIQAQLGLRPRFLAYPSGQYDQNTIDVFRNAGYWAAVTTVQGATHTTDRLFELTRVRVRGTTSADALAQLLATD